MGSLNVSVGNIPNGSGDLPETTPQQPALSYDACVCLNAVIILVCISSFVMCASFITTALIFNVLFQLQTLEFLNT